MVSGDSNRNVCYCSFISCNRTAAKEAINMDEIFAVTSVDDVAGMAAAGFSVSDGELGEEEGEPSEDDLALEETLDIESDSLPDLDMFGGAEE